MRDRRAAFFLIAAVACMLLVPASDKALRWVPEVVAATYTVLAALSFLDTMGKGGDADDGG